MSTWLMREAKTSAHEAWTNEFEPTMLQVLAGRETISMEAHATLCAAVWKYITSGIHNGVALSDEIKCFFTDYTQRIATAAPSDGAALPGYYDAEWGRFAPGVKLANRLLDFVNRHHVQGIRRNPEGNASVMTVRNLAFDSWKMNVLEVLLPRLEIRTASTRRDSSISGRSLRRRSCQWIATESRICGSKLEAQIPGSECVWKAIQRIWTRSMAPAMHLSM
ncbi:hypothetical protein DFH08DRAFT_870701 [Mycena albidolilacea]|uniref:Uncharacterized protein n=1 Tax=Mycena albidolilacea TaxID=1033008 RepID=A0AAD7ERK3_9AGAR|nr:hypothetical protein DFH08DRAFT_870701 [Mycena albidolilacea]